MTHGAATALGNHAHHRGAVLPADALLRYRDGRPLTSRRYDHLWRRVGEHLPWVAAQGVSIHWLRHTTLTWVERHFGYGTARAYAGYTDTTGPATATYIKARSMRRCHGPRGHERSVPPDGLSPDRRATLVRRTTS